MSEGYFGQQGTFDDLSDFNATAFQIRQALSRVRTAIPVKVLAVHGGGVGPAPTVDVQVMVNQTDGQGNKTDHGTIFDIPVARNQGGTFAIINDPQVGDVGHMIMSDRDISAVKANKGAQSSPGSFRRHNLADGVFHPAVICNPANPTQYVQFTATGLRLVDMYGNKIETGAGGITITTAKLMVTGDVIAGSGGANVSLLNHLQTGVVAGGDLSGPPQAA